MDNDLHTEIIYEYVNKVGPIGFDMLIDKDPKFYLFEKNNYSILDMCYLFGNNTCQNTLCRLNDLDQMKFSLFLLNKYEWKNIENTRNLLDIVEKYKHVYDDLTIEEKNIYEMIMSNKFHIKSNDEFYYLCKQGDNKQIINYLSEFNDRNFSHEDNKCLLNHYKNRQEDDVELTKVLINNNYKFNGYNDGNEGLYDVIIRKDFIESFLLIDTNVNALSICLQYNQFTRIFYHVLNDPNLYDNYYIMCRLNIINCNNYDMINMIVDKILELETYNREFITIKIMYTNPDIIKKILDIYHNIYDSTINIVKLARYGDAEITIHALNLIKFDKINERDKSMIISNIFENDNDILNYYLENNDFITHCKKHIINNMLRSNDDKYLDKLMMFDREDFSNELLFETNLTSLKTIKYLLDIGLDPYYSDFLSGTFIHYCCSMYHNDIKSFQHLINLLEYMREIEFDFTVVNEQGFNCLQCLASRGYLELIKYMAEFVDPHIKTSNGKTLAHLITNKSKLNVKYLVEDLKIDLNIKDNDNKTFFDYLSDSDKSKIHLIIYLFESGYNDIDLYKSNSPHINVLIKTISDILINKN